MKYLIPHLILSVLLIFLLMLPIAQAKDSAIIVFDASGSMWGKIKGKAKIEIARDVMATLIKDWNEDIELGLMAYGHREKGSCSDIEVLQTVSKLDDVKLISIINSIIPKGKTPISQSLKKAAEILHYSEEPATVILISDGEETCNADPCLTSQELEKDGIHFTAHVIGFDIKNNKKARMQLQCIANNTGGKYFEAESSINLKKSLFEIKKEVDFPSKIIDLEGTWNAVSTDSKKTYKGELKITQKGNYFTAVSTTGNSTWNGTFNKEKNILTAKYKKNDGTIGGNIILNVSGDRKFLEGKWQSSDGSNNGRYTAKKTGK